MRPSVFVVALGLVLGIVACGQSDAPSSSTGSEARPSETKADTAEPSKPKVQTPGGPAPKKLVVDDLRIGSGPAVKAGDEVTVEYVGVEYESGKQIDASWDRGEPFSFGLGGGAVIPGWEKGVPGMKTGGRRELIIPSDLAYGSGALIFVIDLVAIGRPTDEREGRVKPRIKVPNGPPPKELVIKDLEEGSGRAVEAGDVMALDFVGVNYKTGEEFESTWENGEPSTFGFGTGEVLRGWEEGLKGMRVGGRRELIVPSRLAYKTGTLIYVIDLVDIE